MALSNNLSVECPDITLEFEACLAEYNAVREELRDRAEAHRIVTQYGLLALSAGVTIASLVLGGFTTEQQAIVPIHYLLLVIPALFLYLISVYADESLAEYTAQAYVIHVLRPNMKKILEQYKQQCKSETSSLIFEDLWEWDIFHIAARGATITGAVTGLTKSAITIIMPIILPLALFTIYAIRQKGYLSIWEGGTVAFIFALLPLHLFVMARLRGELERETIKYQRGEEIVSSPIAIKVREMRGGNEEHYENEEQRQKPRAQDLENTDFQKDSR